MIVLTLIAAAHAQDCEKLSIGRLASAPGPGVLVLGERHGTKKDVSRARKVALKLSKLGPVTVAIEAVDPDQQDLLDALATLPPDSLQAALGWDEDRGYPFDAYPKLFALHERGVALKGIGQRLELRPNDQPVQLPPGYIHVLGDTMSDAPVPAELEGRLVETIAWHDHRLARAALDAWDGEGWLVVLVDRTWVQGGLGVQWQAERMADVPVQSALLARADAICYAGDRTLP